MNKKCYLLIGLPGSGKSTLCADLLKHMPELVVVSTDAFIEKHAAEKNISYATAVKEMGDRPKSLMNIQLQQLCKENKSFIWDQTNVFASARKKKVGNLLKKKYEVIAIVTELSEKELFTRLKKREDDTGKFIPLKIIEDMKKNYTRPNYLEGYSQIYLIQDDGVAHLIENDKPILKNRI